MFKTLFENIFGKGTIEPRQEIKLIIQLINADRDWVKDEFKWFHPSGICIWIGNGRKSIAVRFDAESPRDRVTSDNPLRFKTTSFENSLIFEAISKQPGSNQTHKAVAAAKKITEMYGDNQ